MIQNNLMDLSSITFNAGMRIVDSIFIESTFYLFIQIEKTLEENGRLVVYKKSDEGFIKDLEFELEEDIYLSNMIVHDDLFIFKSSSRRVVDGSSKVKPLFILKYLNRTFERKIFDGSTKVYNVGNIFEFNPSKNLFVLNSLANPIVGNDNENVNKLIVYEYRDNRFSEKFVWSGNGDQTGEALRAGIKKASFINNNTIVYIDIQGMKKIVIGDNSCTISVPELDFNISDDTNNHIYKYRNKFIIIADDIIVFDNKFKKLYNKSLSKGEYIVRGDYLLRLNISESDKGKITVYTITDSDIVEKDSFTISGYLTTDRFTTSDIFSISNDNKTILVSFNNKYKIPVLNKRLDDLFPIERPRTEVAYKGRFKNITENPPEEELKSKLFYVKGKIELPDPDNPSEEIEDKGEKITGTVTIKGANKTILVSRTKRAYSIRFRITPSDAIIEILAKNKILSGKKTYTVFPGEYQFSIKKEGYKPINGTIEVTNKNVIIEETMELIEQEQPQPPNQGENPPPTPPEESPGTPPPKPPEDNTKYNVIITIDGTNSLTYKNYKISLFIDNNWVEGTISKNQYSTITDSIGNGRLSRFVIFEDIKKGNYEYKIEPKSSNGIIGSYEQYIVDLETSGSIEVSKESPLYKGDKGGIKNIIHLNGIVNLKGPEITINSNIPDDGKGRMSTFVYLESSKSIPRQSRLLINEDFGYREVFRNRRNLNKNKVFLLKYEYPGKIPVYKRVKMEEDSQTININIKSPKYIFKSNKDSVYLPRVDAIGKGNNILLGCDGDGFFGWYKLSGNVYNFESTTVKIAKMERNTYSNDCHLVMMNTNMDFAFIYGEDNKIYIYKIESNSVVLKNTINCNDGGDKIRHYASSYDGSTMVFTTATYSNDHKGVYILRNKNNSFILEKSFRPSDTNFNEYLYLIPSYNGNILSPTTGKNGLLLYHNGSYVKPNLIETEYVSDMDRLCFCENYILRVSNYGNHSLYGFLYTISGIDITLGNRVTARTMYDDSDTYIIGNNRVLLLQLEKYGEIIDKKGLSFPLEKLVFNNIPDETKKAMKSYKISKYNDGYMVGVILNPTNISKGGNRIVAKRRCEVDFNTNVFVCTKTDQDEWYFVDLDNCPDGLYNSEYKNSEYCISYDGRFVFIDKHMYEFENDTTLSCCGIIGLESEE